MITIKPGKITVQANPNMPKEVAELFRKQHYEIVGRHSGVKLCHWLKKSLTEGRFCYKQNSMGYTPTDAYK